MRLLFFSGMGADHRAFQYLKLEGYEKVFFDWIPPLPDEKLKDYAQRLVKNYPPRPEDVLIGLSMGGFVAQEVAAVYRVQIVIIISSLRSGETLQPLFTAAEKINLLQLVKEDLLKKTIVAGANLVLPQNKKRIRLIAEMLDQFDGAYYKWAMNQVLHWNGADATCPVHHIHGDKDEIFPIKNVKNALIIKGGNHLMITIKAEEVSEYINDILANVTK